MSRRERVQVALLSAWLAACHFGTAKYPWAGGDRVAATNADVRTLNEGYDRMHSGVLVRQIERPTRATLDYAAYHANFMIADPPPEREASRSGAPDTSNPFKGSIDKRTLTGDIRKTPLTEVERSHPLAFAPAVAFLQARRVPGAELLEELGSAVRTETWGLPRGEGTPQGLAEIFLHVSVGSGPPEIWAKIEFVPWFKALGELPDQDGDGYPEVYGRVRSDLVRPTALDALKVDYIGRELGPTEVKGWANQLSSYWYPSFNTDLVVPQASWPDDRTEPEIKRELGGKVFSTPSVVLRGKPQGKPTYDVFVIKAGASSETAKAHSGRGVIKLSKTHPTPAPQATIDGVKRELEEAGGGSWTKWEAQVVPLHDVIRQRLHAVSPKIKGFTGVDGFLFYRNGFEFVAGGDLEKQRQGKNPLPVVVEFKKTLESHDVDFLFVPVPTKEEIFPDEIDPKYRHLVGKVVNPYSRKFLRSLAQAGVEVVDLLPAFLAARTAGDGGGQEPLYQKQDTHWTDRGLRLAADLIGARIKKYPWYRELASHAQTFTAKETTFTRSGDLVSRLPESQKGAYKPETLIAHQVYAANGALYDDDPDSPVVVLGDSFAGVYELTDAEHAGVSAHIAKQISYPTDLVMSYGGGPNVRQKLLRRGADALSSKKLVIWMMTARDLYNYWEEWEPLSAK
jgi:alginate O-acetyltransferase complex protein AlgJ